MADDGLEQMYQEVILDAARHPHGKTVLAPGEADGGAASTVRATHEACTAGSSRQFNPTCGDEATIVVEVGADEPHRIERVAWDGQGCSISQASLSIMVDLVQGKTVDEAMELFRDFRDLMESRGAGLGDEEREDRLDDATVFQGVSKYPMRIKCALLGWEGLRDSTARALAARQQ